MGVSDQPIRRKPAFEYGLRAALAIVTVIPLLTIMTALTPAPAAAAPGEPVVYFTFDDGPDGSVTGRVLDILDDYGAKATFFVVGMNVDSHPAVARRIVAEGHAIANQSYSHARLTTLSDASVLSQFARASAAITNATGTVPSCYRPPYGSVSARVHSLAVEAGLPNAGWTAGSLNTHWGLWDIDTRDWELAYNQTWYQLSRVSAGDVVLMHSVKSFSADIFAEWMAQNAQRFDFQPLPGCGTEPPPPASRPLLRLGSTGPAVLELEQRLTELGYDPGTVDTSFDAATRNAVIAFQASAGIGRDGIVGPITWSKLDGATPGPTPTPTPTPPPASRPLLRLGSTGPAVLELEQRLTELGYDPGTVDTSFDAATRNAVIAFQASAGIGRDGIVGPITWSKLDGATPGPTPTPTPTPTPPPASRPLLRLGSTGPAVLELEQRLAGLGYDPGTVDTSFDAATRNTVIAFQASAGIGRDGIVGPITWSKLDGATPGPTPTPTPTPTPPPASRPLLRLGSTGPAVLELEQRLAGLGYDPGTVDTSFDAATRNAVIAFQASAGIGRDGIVGPITWSKLDGATGP